MSAPDAVRDDQIVVQVCSQADRADQERLYAACFKKPLAPGGLDWRYDRCPAGAAITLLARAPSGLAISGYACSPRHAIAHGVETSLALVGETGDVMTHPEWRKRGFFSRLDRAAMEAARERKWVFAFGLPNRRSAHIFLELGWERIGTVRPWTFLLRGDAAARELRSREGRWAGWKTPFDARRCRAKRRELDAARAEFRSAPITTFEDDVETLSRAIEPHFAFMLRRDAKYLNWRFLRAPSGRHRAIGLYRDGVLAAYVVVQLPREGETVGHVVDVLARDPRASSAALGEGLAALERCSAGAVQATAIDGSWWSRELAQAGFLPPKPNNHLTVILHPLASAHPLLAAARDTTRWYFTDGDRDDETVG